jgi:hypothetical protein
MEDGVESPRSRGVWAPRDSPDVGVWRFGRPRLEGCIVDIQSYGYVARSVEGGESVEAPLRRSLSSKECSSSYYWWCSLNRLYAPFERCQNHLRKPNVPNKE